MYTYINTKKSERIITGIKKKNKNISNDWFRFVFKSVEFLECEYYCPLVLSLTSVEVRQNDYHFFDNMFDDNMNIDVDKVD